MICEIYDHKKKKQLAVVDLYVSTVGLLVHRIIFYNDSVFPIFKTEQDAYDYFDFFLRERCKGGGYEFDEEAIHVLQLEHQRYLLGRMNDARFAVGLIRHFRTAEDEIGVYPLENEIVSWIMEDPAFNRIYLLRKREDCDNDTDAQK